MEWNPDLIYRVRGTWIQRGDGQIMIFDLENAISVLLTSADESASKKRQIELFPAQWEDGFGEEFYDHIAENDISTWREAGPGRRSVPAPGMAQYSAPTEEEFLTMKETFIREAAAGHAGT